MALVTRLISGFYVDGTCEVFAVYDDVSHRLKEIVVNGIMDRVVDVEVEGEVFEIRKGNTRELKFNLAPRNIRYFIPTDDTTKNETPSIICTYYAQHLERGDIDAEKLERLG